MNVLTISDLHCPYQHPGAFDFLSDLKRAYKPKQVVCLGDEIDATAFSRYTKSPSNPNPTEELRQARISLRSLFKLFPRAVAVESNHTVRPYQRAEESGLPVDFLKDIKSVLEAPRGWDWHPRLRHENILYIHGDGFSGPTGHRLAAMRHRISVVMGHVHAFAGVSYLTGITGTIFGANAGCLIDPTSPAFNYGRHHANRPTLGTVVLCDGVPNFVPMMGV